jgi:serine phosphatase RsbU (regulator of sigma subunit)
LYRFISTAIIVTQIIIIINTKHSKFSFLHGYVFNFSVSLAIVLMTVDLGGFNSSYYAGLNLVIIAVNILLPWKALHSFLNGMFTIFLYVGLNLVFKHEFDWKNLIGNLYFMSSTVIISASINHVKFVLIQKDFDSRKSLKAARDALWGEMEIAKQIQTALTPPDKVMGGFEVAAVMIPAESVGGDYYDIVETNTRPWVMIGDVSGHGVESGLIMMMTQTSIRTILAENSAILPSKLLVHLNKVIKENIALLKVDRYLTATAISIGENEITYAGSHQDLLIYREKSEKLETFPSFGTWVGMLDDVEDYMQDRSIQLEIGDMVLLFTDGVTEIGFSNKNMFGQERLEESFKKYAKLPIKDVLKNIIKDALTFCPQQEDDITLVIFRKVA